MSKKSTTMNELETAMRSAKIEALKISLAACKRINVSEFFEIIKNHGLESATIGEVMFRDSFDSKKLDNHATLNRGARGAAVNKPCKGRKNRRRGRSDQFNFLETDPETVDHSAQIGRPGNDCREHVGIEGSDKSHDLDKSDGMQGPWTSAKILSFLEASGEKMSLEDIRNGIGEDSGEVRVGLNRLIESGHVDYEGSIIAKFYAVRPSVIR